MEKLVKSLLSAKPGQLEGLLDSMGQQGQHWSDHQLASLYNNRLSLPLNINLADLDATLASEVRAWCPADRVAAKTLGEILPDTTVPLGLLQLIKDFAKLTLLDPESPWPSEVTQLIYCASIASLIIQHAPSVSQFTPADIEQRLNWAVQQRWIDIPSHQLLAKALTTMRSDTSQSFPEQ